MRSMLQNCLDLSLASLYAQQTIGVSIVLSTYYILLVNLRWMEGKDQHS
jgi:hypothetical protein